MSEQPGVVKSADRVLAVFDLLADRGPLSFTDISAALALPKSSTHNLLNTMCARGYLERGQKEFRLGIRIWQLAQHCTEVEHLRHALRPVMEKLCAATTETVQLAILDGTNAVYLDIVESPHPVKLTSNVGARLSAHASAVGKVLLAGLDPAEARRRLTGVPLERLTEHTITTVDGLLTELALTRERGYGVDGEEFTIGLRCLAMPVRDWTGRTVVGLSVSMPTPRYSAQIAEAALDELRAAVAEAATRLGAR
ncbi:IclR family transcriptional regulator [Kutzneria albida]|uniref:IclR family transcription regulator n=1 Tax=Kutzneria albida DSM 43870 TaxID=1449976 RepID=W5W8M3_9PSEU|nr:IclR family transcriptional regulator [Kutzneria albida]AHH96886.1 IclR family transcription regulator [Kutzneria albida DSM 43870]